MRARRRRRNVGPLGRDAVVDRYLPAVNQIRILRIGRRLAVFFDVHRMPIVESDFAVHAAAGDASRAGILLAAAQAVGKRVVGGHVIHGSGGLVIPVAPRFATIGRNHSALIADQQNDVRVVGIDPALLVIVAAGRAAHRGPGQACVFGPPEDGGAAINDFLVLADPL